MHVPLSRSVLSATLIVAALAACSGGATGILNPSSSQVAASHAAMGSEKIFVSGSFPSSVYVLNSKGQILTTLTDGLNVPQGMATDRSGNLYVANLGDSNILVFNPPYDGTPTTIADEAGAAPEDVAIDDNGDLAVTNLYTASGNGDVAFYSPGATSPTKILSSPKFQQPQYCAFDAHGNLFLDNQKTTGSQTSRGGSAPNDRATSITIGEIRGGINGKSMVELKTASPIDTNGAGSIQLTAGGKIALDNYVTPGGTGGNIYTYHAPKHNNLGAPTILHLTGSVQPSTFAFFPGSKRLITSDYSLDAAQIFTYPGGSLVNTFDLPKDQLVQGVAVYPSQQFSQ